MKCGFDLGRQNVVGVHQLFDVLQRAGLVGYARQTECCSDQRPAPDAAADQQQNYDQDQQRNHGDTTQPINRVF